MTRLPHVFLEGFGRCCRHCDLDATADSSLGECPVRLRKKVDRLQAQVDKLRSDAGWAADAARHMQEQIDRNNDNW